MHRPLVVSLLLAVGCASPDAGDAADGSLDAAAGDARYEAATALPEAAVDGNDGVGPSSPECEGPDGGPPMAYLPEGFCIDRTEVTVAQYDAWLASGPPPEQTPPCQFNESFEPNLICMDMAGVCEGDCSAHPRVCVDWCDASAFCKSVGKKLCAGLRGEAVGWTDFSDPTKDAWQAACSSGGQFLFTYGDEHDASACHDGYPTGGQGTEEVGSRASCQSPDPAYAGVFDLTGNVWEWEDACDGTGPHDGCRMRGGGFRDPHLGHCDFDQVTKTSFIYRESVDPDIGFRCCFYPD
jgi:formylglycine-generating enzyme required for sulfatase activity